MENLLLKMRVASVAWADPITAKAGVDTAVWEDLPLTLRDDEVSVVEGDPEETETYSHENDAPEEYDVTGTGKSVTGSFIKATAEQVVDLLGGELSGSKVYVSAKKLQLTKALKFTLKDGGTVIVPKASGSVNLNANLGKGGLLKFPFKFKCLVAAPTWDCDLIL